MLATLEELALPPQSRSPQPLSFIADMIPAAEAVVASGDSLDSDELVRNVVRANIRNSVGLLAPLLGRNPKNRLCYHDRSATSH